MQDDILYEWFTPREAFKFAVRLKCKMDLKQEKQTVDYLISQLGLKDACDTLIGSNRRKAISGGERKRTAIGVELITDPSVLILDEPTSGLDSKRALQIVKLLRELSY